MANGTSLRVDIDPMLRKMIKTNKKIMGLAEKGVGKAMLQLKSDMILQAPTAPLKEGYLRGSTSIFLQNRKIDTPDVAGEKKDKQVTSYKISIAKTEIVGVIGLNVPYAARWHEVPANFSEPSAGNKYLESKMANNKLTYKKIITNTIAEGRPYET